MLLSARVERRSGLLLDCWLSGGTRYEISPPSHPYYYNTHGEFGGVPTENTRLLSIAWSNKTRTLYKVSLPSVYQVRQSRQFGVSLESDVRFIERLAIDYGFSQKDRDASVLAFDIEAASTTGQFPNPKNPNDTLLAVAVRGKDFGECYVGNENEIVRQFVKCVQTHNPDIIATFSGTAFDYEFLLNRFGADSLRLGRLDDAPFIKIVEYERGKRIGVDKTTLLNGRICFDVYDEVRFDSSLSGIRRNLKTVGRHFFGDINPIIEVDRARLRELSEEDLKEYCLSDARLTHLLAEHYLGTLKELAFVLRVPLDFVVHRSPSHIGNVVYGRQFSKLGIVSDGANIDRFRGVLW